MSAPKFLNDPAASATESIDGLLVMRPDLQRLPTAPNVIVQRNVVKGRVAIVCGGGSGHEPAHAGFVADGLLTAAVCGAVFASPSASSVLETIRYLSDANDNAGVLVLIKNYGGDVLNFGFAMCAASNEQARDGKPRSVKQFIIGDDIAFGASNNACRGVAGVVLLYKILGEAARQGQSLEDLLLLSTEVHSRMRSIGASLSSCALPGHGPSSVIPSDKYELGLGIHGEPGKEQRELRSVDAIVADMLDLCANPPESPDFTEPRIDTTWTSLSPWEWANNNSEFIVFVNNLGATTDLEMNVVLRAVALYIKNKGGKICRLCVGRAMTALDMHGFSLTLINVGDQNRGVIPLLEAASSPITPFAVSTVDENWTPASDASAAPLIASDNNIKAAEGADRERSAAFASVLAAVVATLGTLEAELNKLDAAVGDGDIGSGTARACTALSTQFGDRAKNAATSASTRLVGLVVADTFAGTSGPLYGAFFSAAAGALEGGTFEPNPAKAMVLALRRGVDAVGLIGGAKKGDRTMLDVWIPVVEYCEAAVAANSGISLKEMADGALKVAIVSSAETAQLKARKGRSRYSNGKEIGHKDPGCELAVLIIRLVSEQF